MSAVVMRLIGGQPAGPAVVTGIITWFVLTGRGDLAPRRDGKDGWSGAGPYIHDRSIAVSSRLIWVTSVPPPIQARSSSGRFGNSVHTRS